MLHAKCVDRQVMLIAIEHTRLLLLRESLIENLLRMVHLLLVVYWYWLLSVVDEVLRAGVRIWPEGRSRAGLADLSSCSWLVQIVTHMFRIQGRVSEV